MTFVTSTVDPSHHHLSFGLLKWPNWTTWAILALFSLITLPPINLFSKNSVPLIASIRSHPIINCSNGFPTHLEYNPKFLTWSKRHSRTSDSLWLHFPTLPYLFTFLLFLLFTFLQSCSSDMLFKLLPISLCTHCSICQQCSYSVESHSLLSTQMLPPQRNCHWKSYIKYRHL